MGVADRVLNWLYARALRAADAIGTSGSQQPPLAFRTALGSMGVAQPTSTVNELEFSWREAYFFSCLNVIATNAMAVPLKVQTLGPTGGTLRAFSPSHLRHAVKQRAAMPPDRYATWLRDKGLEAQEVDDAHPLRQLLDTPNTDADTWPEFIAKAFLHLVGTGDTYWELVGGKDNAPPNAMYLMQPDRVTIKADPVKWVGGYFYKTGYVDVPYTTEEVFHCRLPHPMNDLYGLSRADTLDKVLKTRWNAYIFNNRFFEVGGDPGGMWVPEAGTSIPEAEGLRLNDMLQAKHVGVQNMGKSGFFSHPLKWIGKGTSPKDMEFAALIQQTEHDISGVVGVPRALTGRTSDVNRSNMDALKVLLWAGTMQPLFSLLTAKMNSNLCPRYGPGVFVEADYSGIAVLQEDADARSKRAVAGFDASILSRNEARDQVGAEPLETPDGDVFKTKTGDVFVAVGTDPQDEIARKEEADVEAKAEATARLEQMNAEKAAQPGEAPDGAPVPPDELRGVYPLYARGYGDENHAAEHEDFEAVVAPFRGGPDGRPREVHSGA